MVAVPNGHPIGIKKQPAGAVANGGNTLPGADFSIGEWFGEMPVEIETGIFTKIPYSPLFLS
jgi:hypothetical protein